MNGYLWYCHLGAEDDAGPAPFSTRLTTWIDRLDMSKTKSSLFGPREPASEEIPEAAWTTIEPPPEPITPAKPTGKKG